MDIKTYNRQGSAVDLNSNVPAQNADLDFGGSLVPKALGQVGNELGNVADEVSQKVLQYQKQKNILAGQKESSELNMEMDVVKQKYRNMPGTSTQNAKGESVAFWKAYQDEVSGLKTKYTKKYANNETVRNYIESEFTRTQQSHSGELLDYEGQQLRAELENRDKLNLAESLSMAANGNIGDAVRNARQKYSETRLASNPGWKPGEADQVNMKVGMASIMDTWLENLASTNPGLAKKVIEDDGAIIDGQKVSVREALGAGYQEKVKEYENQIKMVGMDSSFNEMISMIGSENVKKEDVVKVITSPDFMQKHSINAKQAMELKNGLDDVFLDKEKGLEHELVAKANKSAMDIAKLVYDGKLNPLKAKQLLLNDKNLQDPKVIAIRNSYEADVNWYVSYQKGQQVEQKQESRERASDFLFTIGQRVQDLSLTGDIVEMNPANAYYKSVNPFESEVEKIRTELNTNRDLTPSQRQSNLNALDKEVEYIKSHKKDPQWKADMDVLMASEKEAWINQRRITGEQVAERLKAAGLEETAGNKSKIINSAYIRDMAKFKQFTVGKPGTVDELFQEYTLKKKTKKGAEVLKENKHEEVRKLLKGLRIFGNE